MGFRVLTLDAPALAKEAGNARASNMAAVGALSHFLERYGISDGTVSEAITACLSEKAADVSLKAFCAGRAAVWR
jgi:Pyruvate/2-oxoacid:ferredoxin oxidoreductase gamma subunit